MIYRIKPIIEQYARFPKPFIWNGNTIAFEQQAAIVTAYILRKDSDNSVYPLREEAEQVLAYWAECLCEPIDTLCTELQADIQSKPFQSQADTKFTFIDLFAGIGGFRTAMQNLGGRCIFSSEWDENAQKTYYENYGDVPFGDITLETTKEAIPEHFDVLCAGFPCQAFSLAGKKRGFEETRGTLFFDVAEILRRRQPRVFFLENVKGLAIHDHGRTLQTILQTLDEIGYVVPKPQIVNAMYFGVPQHRERIYIVGFRKDLNISREMFQYPQQEEVTHKFIDIREQQPVPAKYYLSETYWNTLIRHKERHAAKGNGFGYEIIKDNEVSNAIVVGGMGRERNLVIDTRQNDFTHTTHIKGEYNKLGIRRMTPREWARLQGYSDDFRIVVSDVNAYKQFGNSVAVPAIQATAYNLLTTAKII